MTADGRLAAVAGWGHGAACWEPLAAAGTRLCGLSLPGHEPEVGHEPTDCTLDGAAGALAGDWEVIMGWSLGGLAALEAVRSGLARPRGLVLLATPPSFLARPTYADGLDPQVLADFRAGLEADLPGTLRRFYALQFRGDRAPRRLWASARDRYLASRAGAGVLQAWLDVLAAADLSARPPALELPVLVLHGSGDGLVDPAAVDFFRGCGPQVTGHIIDGAGHAPHIAHAEETGKRIGEFVRALA